MKRSVLTYGLMVLALMAFAIKLAAQADDYPLEKVLMATDRTLYIVGEDIRFSAQIERNDNEKDGLESRVIYLELIKPDGSRVAGGKYEVRNFLSEGCLHIPEESLTGYYYLKAYTRWMRNGSVGDYCFILLKIINPYNAEMPQGDKSTAAPKESQPDSDSLSFKIFTGKSSFQPGDEIQLQIEKKELNKLNGKLCLIVVPEESFVPRDSIPRDSIPGDGVPSLPDIQYFPETRGISVSGRLVEEGTGVPYPNALVNLSIIGDKDAMAIRTNNSGRFFFALPSYYGNRDIFLCGEDLPGKETGILIDNDFCSRPVNLPSPAFDLSEKETGTALKMALNQKILSVFYADTMTLNPAESRQEVLFYGKPDEILVMDKYIDLPTMEDYFSELLGMVDVRKFEGRKFFRFNSTRTEMTIYDPLVLIDWVAVNDIVKILAMQPRQIDRIELINAPYIKGNITYGGIISFISKNNDFAGIDLPSSGTFINYKFLEECDPADIPPAIPSNHPDPRNTVYWNPDLELDAAGKAEVSFIAPAITGNYVILLRDIGQNQILIKRKLEIIPEADNH